MKPIILPEYKSASHKKTLILDIDETLIHCLDERDPDEEQPDVIIRIPMTTEEQEEEGLEYADAGINIRPHLIECLKQANKIFQVVTFTASEQMYADAILDFIDPKNELIQYRLYR